ncbi:response regulator [Sphingobacterium wenxiniae]|uniref:DNA-binding response regulator, NarL/FixJ family, contains REC and HTH domains n=1 Tax=Sphingobacterium wenxiniae TaxID=683125 RepID=A0A1I6NS06_9SPHI|nr:response regulator [Sphingobacterium wenxiniae]SFS30651.1 DNA-binding response regulator, NarL/FixJ family, contains REC and HTH domains [Sphingobacterium wenxiniae]
MFKKILIAEDHQSSNISVQKTLHDLDIKNADYVYYCDHALTWLKNAIRAQDPYEVLITDLSFEEDNNTQIILNGTDLIKEARAIQPDLKVIVFSVESRSSVIDDLFKVHAIDGYVRKARHDADHLKEALQAVYKNKYYLPDDMKQSIRNKNAYEFTTVDIAIVSLLYQGELQKNIPECLKRRNIKPSSLSSVEKRLNLMKEAFGFTKNEQLVVYCKEKELI